MEAQIKDFIAIPTIAHDRKANQAGICFISQILKEIGFTVNLEGNSPFQQSVIIAKYKNEKSDKKVTLYAHYDVEKIHAIEKWNSKPFELTKKEKRYFARGIADNKGILLTRALALLEMKKEGKILPNILWLIQGEEEVAGKTTFEVIPKHIHEFKAKLYVEETGIYKHGKPVIFYLPKTAIRPSFLDDLNKTIYSGEASFENRHLNKFTTCPFLLNIPKEGYYIGFGPNDKMSAIHKPNESLDIENLHNHKEVFKKFIHWVSITNL